jgi:hypothetical protein
MLDASLSVGQDFFSRRVNASDVPNVGMGLCLGSVVVEEGGERRGQDDLHRDVGGINEWQGEAKIAGDLL